MDLRNLIFRSDIANLGDGYNFNAYSLFFAKAAADADLKKSDKKETTKNCNSLLTNRQCASKVFITPTQIYED